MWVVMSSLTWNWQYLKWINKSQKSNKRSMARTRTITVETKREGQRKAKRHTQPSGTQKQSECACLMFVCFLVCSYNRPWKHDEFLGQTKKGQNWSTTHVSGFGKKTQRLNMGIMNDAPLDTLYQCLISGFPLHPSPSHQTI
jgi:hypothetical protein